MKPQKIKSRSKKPEEELNGALLVHREEIFKLIDRTENLEKELKFSRSIELVCALLILGLCIKVFFL